ncbi:MAG: SCO family protein [Thermoflexales bacterium]|nr:SCO family protein [Thermoflexales bacterium]MDW8352088.1 SCO family protein [Anaerolineae bacterium]
MASISSIPPVANRHPSASLALLTVASVLIGFGVVASFLGAAYLQDVALLAEAPAAFWAFICGQPLADTMIAPLILIAGALSAILASALLLQPATRLRVVIAGVTLLSTLVAAGSGYVFGAANRAAVQPLKAIAYLTPPRPMPDFALTNDAGGVTRLSDLRGKTVLLFFGYTHCPDICPMALSRMRKLKASLGEDAKQVAFVFISVDGTRDTPAVLRRHVRLFDPDFIGLTGAESQVRLVALEYGAHFRSNRTGNSRTYTVDHTADTYVIDAQGRWRFAYGISAPIETVVREVRQVIRVASR